METTSLDTQISQPQIWHMMAKRGQPLKWPCTILLVRPPMHCNQVAMSGYHCGMVVVAILNSVLQLPV